MVFRLALAFGCPAREVIDRVSSEEFTYWLAFYRLEPWGCDPDDWRAALVASVTANAAGGKKGGKPFKTSEFIPRRGSPALRRSQALAESRRMMESKSRGDSSNRQHRNGRREREAQGGDGQAAEGRRPD